MNDSRILIRKARQKDLTDICELFKISIEKSCSSDYTQVQIAAWISASENQKKWVDKIMKQYFLVAEMKNVIVGFVSLEKNYIDLLYVHPEFQQKRVATQLMAVVEMEANHKHHHIIRTDASITAKPFFVSRGYDVVQENKIRINDIHISNWEMKKEFL